MKNIIRILAIPALLLAISGCTQDALEDINTNHNNPTDVPSSLLITDVMTRSAFTITGSDFSFYASVYVEHNVGIYNQMYNAEIRTGEPISSTTYNNIWDAAYENLYNLKLIINKTSAGGSEEGNYHTLGIAQILTAYNLAMLTDLMGDVPYSEALQPGVIYQPKLDKQEDLYTEIFNLLNNAITNLGMETEFPSLDEQDFIFGGDESLWLKFAYGLKARYTTHLALRNGGKWNDVIDFANNSFTSSDEQAQFNYNGASSLSPYYTFFTDRDYFGASLSLHQKLIARNDPRDAVFFIPYPGEESLVFAPNGTPSQVQGMYGISALSTPTSPTYLMSYHEVEFLKAEAYARLNQLTNAENALKNAITAAFIKVGLTAGDATTYYDSNVAALFNANPLQEIMVQKYLAFFEEESVEAYNDVRRLKAMDEDFITLANPASDQFPLRFTYGADDVTTNLAVAAAYGDGTYVYTENVWWAGGTR